jgi:aminoglycoside 6'-N-acetyltransferase
MSTPDSHDGLGHPELTGARVRLRPGDERDVPVLCAILAEPEVACWWGDPEPASAVAAGLRGDDESVLLVVEAAGQVIGGIQYHEENDPMYRHAGIDIYLSIDPAAANHRAIRCYEKVGFRRVGVQRQYERGPDGRFHDGVLMDLLRPELCGEAG